MSKSDFKIGSSILLLIFELLLLYSIFFLFKDDGYTTYTVIISYMSPIVLMLYLILLGPFSMKGFDSKLRKHLCMMGIIMTFTIMIYFSLSLIEPLIGFFVLKVIIIAMMLMMLMMLVLQGMIISDIESVDMQRMKDYIQFIINLEMPYFESQEVKKMTFVIYPLKIAACIFLGVQHISFFYICFFIFISCATLLYIHMSKHFAKDSSTLNMLKKLSVVELLVYTCVLILTIFEMYPISMMLLILSNFKIYYLKEKIQYQRYILL